MNFNFPSFLTNSMRILNIINRSLPLVKEITPTIKTIKNKIVYANKKTNIEKKEDNNISSSNSSLTFFK